MLDIHRYFQRLYSGADRVIYTDDIRVATQGQRLVRLDNTDMLVALKGINGAIVFNKMKRHTRWIKKITDVWI